MVLYPPLIGSRMFSQPIDLSGLPDKWSRGSGFSHWKIKMKLWLKVKIRWLMLLYNPPIVDQGKAETVIVYAMWDKKDGVSKAIILAVLANTQFDVYSSYAYNVKLLWEKLD